jgi:hypothetical protein
MYSKVAYYWLHSLVERVAGKNATKSTFYAIRMMKAVSGKQMKPLPPIFFHNSSVPQLKLHYIVPQSTNSQNLSESKLKPIPVPQLITEEKQDNEKWLNNARCTPYICPEIIKNLDVAPLFPERDMTGDLVVFTIVHQTQNDMSDWNAEVFEEREKLVGDVRIPYLYNNHSRSHSITL